MTTSRLLLRGRHRIHDRRVPARRLPEVVALTAMTALVIIALAVTTTNGRSWRDIARGQAVNVASATAIALFAYLLFVLRFRRAQLHDYLKRCEASPESLFSTPTTESWRQSDEQSLLAARVVEDTMDAPMARSHLLVADVDGRRQGLLRSIVQKLAARRLAPVVVEVPSGSTPGSIIALAKDRFVAQLVGAAGDPRNAERLFSFLVRRGRLVVVVDGLERVAGGKAPAARRERIAGLLAECVIEGVQFVAAVEESLAPDLTEVSVIRIGQMSTGDLAAFMLAELTRQGVSANGLERSVAAAFECIEPTRDPGLLRLAGRLVHRYVRTGMDPHEAVEFVFGDPCAFRRHLRWVCRWALNCEPRDVAAEHTPEAAALAALGLEALHAQSPVVAVSDACAGMNPAERRRVLAGLARLEERGIASVDGAEVVRFLHPAWLALAGLLAVGLKDSSLWPDLVRHEAPKFTLAALTASLLLDAGAVSGGTRSFVDLLRHLGLRAPEEASLDLVVAVVTALQSEQGPLDFGDKELSWLVCSWEEATEPVRLEFLDNVDFSRHPGLLEFLWAQVSPPRWGLNSWRLRRAVCRRIITHGAFSWNVLGKRWEALVAAGAAADLSTMGRDGPGWQTCGAALASLGWILPGVVLQLEGTSAERGDRLLGELACVFGPTVNDPTVAGSTVAGATVAGSSVDARSAGRPTPELGLEISLAEGYKIAAEYASTTPDRGLETIESHGSALFSTARSWLSRLALLQAFGLSPQSPPAAERFAVLLRRTNDDDLEHPFVREAAAVLMRGPDIAGVVGKDLWIDDPQILGDGGLDLSPPAHRLLGLSTLLVNLAEHALWRARDVGGRSASRPALADAVALRERALADRCLPMCFVRSSHAATMFEHPCTCEFSLCGPDALGPVGFRHPSRAFVQRSEAVCATQPLSGTGRRRPFAGAAFRGSWQLLDERLGLADQPLARDR